MNEHKNYVPGMRVVIRGEEWVIRKTELNSRGNHALYCTGISPLVVEREAVFLDDMESIEIMNPAQVKLVRDDSSHYIKTQLFIESQWRRQIVTDNDIHCGPMAAMDSLPYQLEPASMALNRPKQRILIADTVGLGKTLEAGILMSELIARGKGKRILVVTVTNMMAQFQREMWCRFTIPLVRLDSAKIQRVRQTLPASYNPFYRYDRTIISMDTLKQDIEYRTHLEHAYWDIIVIDEAQNVAKRGSKRTQRAQLAELLAGRSETMIMLSATPHDGHAESFASLMNMLDPTAIADPSDYTPDDIKGLFIRRFKKDVNDQLGTVMHERRVTEEHCETTELEDAAFEALDKLSLKMTQNASGAAGNLFKTTLLKSLLSSPKACIQTVNERLKNLRRHKEPHPDIEPLESFAHTVVAIDMAHFSRYQRLLALLKSKEYGWKMSTNDRIVIFTERVSTMKLLAEQLQKDLNLRTDHIATMSGEMSDSEQMKVVEDFSREKSKVLILVASDVASEGLNLHYMCHRLIHFDIPWSLMVFQQRNGRIDRYGQTESPDIRYFMTLPSNEKLKGDMRVLEILVAKEQKAHDNLGDPSLLLQKDEAFEEEQITASAIEHEQTLDDFESMLDGEFDWDAFTDSLAETPAPAIIAHEPRTTLFKDIDYVRRAAEQLHMKCRDMDGREGLAIEMLPELKRRFRATLPSEVDLSGEELRLCTNKKEFMDEMKKSLQNELARNAWPDMHYLWPLHPILNWLNDRLGLVFQRSQAPIIRLNTLNSGEIVYLLEGTIPNRRSNAVIDETFAIRTQDGTQFTIQDMEQAIRQLKLASRDISNVDDITDDEIARASACLPDVIAEARKHLAQFASEYENRALPMINDELAKLQSLLKKHKAYHENRSAERAREREDNILRIENMFKAAMAWYNDTLHIEGVEHAWIRVMGVVIR